MRILKIILLLIFLGVVTIFTVQNMETLRLSFLSWHAIAILMPGNGEVD